MTMTNWLQGSLAGHVIECGANVRVVIYRLAIGTGLRQHGLSSG